MKSICILGRQPSLGLAELESLYGPKHIQALPGATLLDIEAGDINFTRLGGTIKVARILATITSSSWSDIEKYLSRKVPENLSQAPAGKFTLGLSVYGYELAPQQINTSLLKLKTIIKNSGRPVRVVPNKTPALSSAQVLHNKLTSRGGWELLVVADGRQTILAQTMFVQDIEGYASRDQARPKRDARVGMLPPKLAQIIINLSGASFGDALWDPFCGTGVILQEALLMEIDVYGSDIDQRMINYTKQNLDWLYKKHDNDYGGPLSMQYHLEVADATTLVLKSNHVDPIDIIASEVYLGRPLSKLPEPAKLQKIVNDVNTIIKKSLVNFATQLKPGAQVCLAVPAWRVSKNQFKHLPVIDHLTDMGYTRLGFKTVRAEDLIYYREGQIVARQILVLKRT